MTHDVLLTPGAHRAAGLATDDIVKAMMRVEVAWMRVEVAWMRVEVAWMRALAQGGAATADLVGEVLARRAARKASDG